MVAGAGGRVVRPATQAVPTTDDTHLPSSSTSGNTTSSPNRIPSLKFPFLWEAKKPPAHRVSRSAEQKAALIALGAGAGAASTSSLPGKKQEGVFLSEEAKKKSMDLLLLLAYEVTRRMILRQLGAAQLALARQCWSKIVERIIHQVIVNCKSFTLIGVAGFLVGSVPLFAEGCALVRKAFFTRFHSMSHKVHQGEIIRLLIEALDMFLIGTALLTFGMGMYTMFYGSRGLQTLKGGAGIRSLTQAKTRIGHAILLLLQVGVLEKFENVPLATGLDMACCGGAVLASSAGVFLLSKLNTSHTLIL